MSPIYKGACRTLQTRGFANTLVTSYQHTHISALFVTDIGGVLQSPCTEMATQSLHIRGGLAKPLGAS